MGARRKLGIPEDGFWVGSVTSVVDYEGLPTLVESVGLLRDQGEDIRCAIVGDGVALPDLRELIKELDLEDRILTPGRVPRDEALLWYQALDLFVIPRIDTEVTRTVTPIKGLEAQALGVPVIVSDLPALREVNATESLVFPPYDTSAATLAVLEARGSSSHSVNSAARAFVARRTWLASANMVANLYAGTEKVWQPGSVQCSNGSSKSMPAK